MQKVFTSNKIEKAKCQKHFWTEKSEIFARKLKKQNKTGYKKPLKTLGFSRVKVAQEEGYAARGKVSSNRSALV